MKRVVTLLCLVSVAFAAPTRAQTNPHGNNDLDCASCHDEASWAVAERPPRFDHETTGFPLVGRHAEVACRSCHRDLAFARVGTSCADCHADPHRLRLGTDCASCHSPSGWTERDEMRRRHDTTRLPLVGAHERLDCDACHREPPASDFAGTPSDCYACHAADYAATAAPPHASSGFGTDCVTCHGVFTTTWGSGDFLHSAVFPLTGAHAGAACAGCHASGYAGTPTECVACHQGDYDGATDPAHVAAGFSTDCAACHSTAGWQPTSFDHATSGFTLTGEHRNLTCVACHASGYAGTPTDCVACHQDDFDGTTDPAHVASGFPTDCTACHSTAGWQPATFDHAASAFPLTGGHAAVSCVECHASGYTNTPTDCVACHQDDYDGTTDPAHAASGFPTDCTACHTTSGWTPASFNHDASSFPLTGAHRTVACADCHGSGYAGTPTECVACHQDDYDGTNDPAHVAAGFPTDCVACHTTTGWEPSTWNHDTLFPIYSGRHRQEWNNCADCHTVPSNYAVFECIFCHEHSRSQTDGQHDEVSGYQYLSTACFECHPRGEAEDK